MQYFQRKKSENKNDVVFRISYSTQRYKVWSFSIIFFTDKANDAKKCSPLPWSKRQLGWGLVPFSAPKPSLQGATQPVLLAENQVSPRHPNPFFPGPPWLDFPTPGLPRATWLCIWIPFVPGATKFWAPVLRNHVLPRANGWFHEQVPFSRWEHTWVFQPLICWGISFGLKFSKNHVFVPSPKFCSFPEQLRPKIWSHTNKGTWNTQPSCHNEKGTWKPQLVGPFWDLEWR